MAELGFVTLDVFTTARFGGNPLAVLPDARELSDAAMQLVAREFNFSETTFVLPPDDPGHDARVRIFTPRHELPFAGHPNVGTGHVLAALRGKDRLVFEEEAGLVAVAVEGGLTRIDAPRAFSAGRRLDPAPVAASAGLRVEDVDVSAHPPLVGSCGTPFVIARVGNEALTRAAYDDAAFRAADARAGMAGRLALLLYTAPEDGRVRARMFAPLGGTTEDPATGSAAVAMAGLLLSLGREDEAALTVAQGVEMGRPSEMHVRAWREEDGIRTSVAGACVAVARGTITV